MTSYNLNNLKIIEESLRLEMLEKERRRSSKSNEKKKKIETARLLETALQDARLRFKRGEYQDALIWFTKALDIQPSDKGCLVSRSKCYLKLGDPHNALKDAEAALEEDKEFNKGLYQKAEALYSMGDFEYSLVYYHRGHKLRPELNEFKLGIQKAQEAIDNSIGTAARVKLENKGDLSFFAKQDDLGKKAKGYSKPTTNKAKVGTNRNKETKAPAPSNKTVKQLLGELYADKAYLEKLMKDSDFINHEANQKVHDLVQDGISYLDTRTEFWRQQKPLYARKKDKPVKGRKIMTRDQVAMIKLSKFMKKLEDIDSALSEGLPSESLKLAEDTLKEVQDTSPSVISNRDEIISNLHSCIGNALLDLDKPQKALKHHTKDLDISNKNDHNDGKSRALDNIGRSYARLGNYQKAVDSWQEKLPLVKTPLESTWLRHEIGRCHLEMGNFTEARDYGEQALEAAKEAEDEVWQLNSSVLIAQADVKLNDLDRALKSFDKSMDLANVLEDEAAQNAISKAVSDLKAQMNSGSGEKGSSEDEEADDHRKSDDEDNKDEARGSPESQDAEDGHDNSNEEKHDSSEEVEQKESTEKGNADEQEESNEKADASDKEELAGTKESSDSEKQDEPGPETA